MNTEMLFFVHAISAIVAGNIWGTGIPGFFKAVEHEDEVLFTLMMFTLPRRLQVGANPPDRTPSAPINPRAMSGYAWLDRQHVLRWL